MYKFRNFSILVLILLGLVYLPAQAFLSSNTQDLWPVMSQHFTIPTDPDQVNIRRQIDRDLRHPKYIQKLTLNARPYLYYVFQETEKKHLPAELALLPMIESEYKPSGESNVGAAGLWQLMPSTANNYGVKMNSWYDGRRSTIASTKVALSFLSYLYQMFNHNWLLALAAYNAGPGTVQAAIHYNREHGKPTNFWALSLPKQTENYIPKLLALAQIIQHPRSYGVHLMPVPNKSLTSTVTIKKQMPLKTIANLAHTSVTTVKKLNPALKRSVTPPHQVVTLVIPAGKKPAFIKQMNAQQKKSEKKVVVKKTTVTTAKKTLHTKTVQTHTKQKTVVTYNIKHPTKKASAYTTHASYTVRRGDSLRVIARRHHTTIAALMHANHLSRVMLQIGQHLTLKQA